MRTWGAIALVTIFLVSFRLAIADIVFRQSKEIPGNLRGHPNIPGHPRAQTLVESQESLQCGENM